MRRTTKLNKLKLEERMDKIIGAKVRYITNHVITMAHISLVENTAMWHS